MISFLYSKTKKGLQYLQMHPQIGFVLLLIIIMPLLFLYTGQQFLDAGKANQDRLQKDRVGIIQDVFISLIQATNFNAEIAQEEIKSLSETNPDIVDFKVVERNGKEFIPLASLNDEEIGQPIENTQFFKDATVRLDESIIFEFNTTEGRQWFAYRASETDQGDLYFVYTQLSLKNIDDLFAARERSALYSLVIVYLFVVAIAWWQVKLTDYRYLYMEVRKANEMKDLFTNMIAHELRAPLTAIRGYASMIEEKTDKQEKEYSVRIRESSERLITIVNDLLDVARIQSGKLSMKKESVDVSNVVTKVLQELRISSVEKNIELTESGTDAVHTVIADPKRLHQALTNLVSNAIKYTQKGSIELSLEEKRNVVELRVKDTGMGISAEDQKKLFAPFFRVSNEDVGKITGTGLGMWITKQLIELMGATIGVESIKGVGTHVVISLPKKKDG